MMASLQRVTGCVRECPRQVAALSFLAVAPALWPPRPVTGDMPSHLYNAWLATRIQNGELHGLWLQARWTNVLVDRLLALLLPRFGPVATLRATDALAALLFFWCAFALAATLSRSRPWRISPGLLLLSHGLVFQLGFMNFFVALALAVALVAVLWEPQRNDWPLVAGLVLLGAVAHPLPLLWALAVTAYAWLARRLAAQHQLALLISGVAVIGIVGALLQTHEPLRGMPLTPLVVLGTAQLGIFGAQYKMLAALLAVVWLVGALQLALRRGWREPNVAQVGGLYTLSMAVVAAFPYSLSLGPSHGALVYLTERWSLMAAIWAAVGLAFVPRGALHAVGAGIALAFFALLFRDQVQLDARERQIEVLVAALPPEARVVDFSKPTTPDLFTQSHMLDLACVGRCFSFWNYEAASQDFRIRAEQGNTYLMAGYDVTAESRALLAQHPGLPLYILDNCASSATQLCITRAERPEQPIH